jgi:hypothetical protein
VLREGRLPTLSPEVVVERLWPQGDAEETVLVPTGGSLRLDNGPWVGFCKFDRAALADFRGCTVDCEAC